MAMTAALIATRQMRKLRITENVVLRAEQLKNGLLDLSGKHPMVDEVRGMGLMLAFSVGSVKNVRKLQQELGELGVKNSLSTGRFIRLLPPTIITEDEVSMFLEKLDRAFLKLG
jgi:acetylornithine/succinyldiaminopimelate/putrescine aminotransferase